MARSPEPLAVTPEVMIAGEPVASRILDGALACIGRVGLAKTTYDDVAKEAGVSRATAYRCFAGRGVLMRAVVAREADRLTAEVRGAVAASSTLDDALSRSAVVAVEYLESID